MKELRERTGAGMMDGKGALQETDGDMDKAIELLRVKGQAKAAKRGDRAASEGLVHSYVHHNGKVGALVEINCETDFVARNDDFVEFAREVASHVAAAAPTYVSEEEVPEDDREAEMRVFKEQAAGEGKPEEVQQKIAEGRMKQVARGERAAQPGARQRGQARRQDDRGAARRAMRPTRARTWSSAASRASRSASSPMASRRSAASCSSSPARP